MLNNTRTYSDIWQNCLDQIKARTSAEEFEKWFQPIVPLEFDGTTLRLRVPNESYVRQIEKNYIPFLKPIISQLYGQQTRLHYAVPRATAPAVPVAADADTTAISRFNTQTNTANIKNPFVIPGLKKIIIDPQLNPNLTFATIIDGECNRLARSASMTVAATVYPKATSSVMTATTPSTHHSSHGLPSCASDTEGWLCMLRFLLSNGYVTTIAGE